MQPRVYFVTGTDTEIGKTLCSTLLLRAAALNGKKAIGFKPVASEADSTGCNADVLSLQTASNVCLPYTAHNCYTFREATAPHLAAADEGVEIHPQVLSNGLAALKQQGDWILVEGAGGWFTPLGSQVDFADWVAAEKLPVIVIVGMKLGCINHAMLTVRAVLQAGLPLAGWVANCVDAAPHRFEDYLATLKARIPAPLLGVVPYAPSAEPQALLHYFSPSCLW